MRLQFMEWLLDGCSEHVLDIQKSLHAKADPDRNCQGRNSVANTARNFVQRERVSGRECRHPQDCSPFQGSLRIVSKAILECFHTDRWQKLRGGAMKLLSLSQVVLDSTVCVIKAPVCMEACSRFSQNNHRIRGKGHQLNRYGV
jgi:hypothetical protein